MQEQFMFKFNEGEILSELRSYICNTYGEHYANEENGLQTFQLIAKDPLRGLAFATGNCMKYADRYGKKNGYNRKDLIKIAHYAILALYCDGRYNENSND